MNITQIDRSFDFFADIARLHATELSAGLLPLFGVQFLERMYRFASSHPGSLIIAAIENGSVAGFVMGSAAPSQFYAGLLLRTWPILIYTFARRPRAIIRALSLARYVSKASGGAELLSIVVRSGHRGTGLATKLLHAFEHQLGACGITKFYVTAADTQPAALRFYQKTGGIIVAESDLGGLRTLTFMYGGTKTHERVAGYDP